MARCTCGCSEGLHWQTNIPASCAKCGPKKCPKFVAEKVTAVIIKQKEGPLPNITYAVSSPTNEKGEGDLASKDQERLA